MPPPCGGAAFSIPPTLTAADSCGHAHSTVHQTFPAGQKRRGFFVVLDEWISRRRCGMVLAHPAKSRKRKEHQDEQRKANASHTPGRLHSIGPRNGVAAGEGRPTPGQRCVAASRRQSRSSGRRPVSAPVRPPLPRARPSPRRSPDTPQRPPCDPVEVFAPQGPRHPNAKGIPGAFFMLSRARQTLKFNWR